jgi:tight adherence protein B
MSDRSPLALAMLAAAAVIAAVTAGLAFFAGSAHAAPSLSAAGHAKFPDRAFVLTLPEHTRLGSDQVTVMENGAPVHRLRIRPLGAGRLSKLGVVLAVDASSSMRGDAYASAFEAARAFADERSKRQPLALVTFSSTTSVPMRFTTNPQQISSVLDNPGEPSGGTHLYDGALRGIELIRQSKLPGGFVVVLSDGDDHGSEGTAAKVVAAARAARVRVYTIGLRSSRFDAGALEYLADATGGKYTEANSTVDLNDIYTSLGAELSNVHLVTYRSLAPPHEEISVAVDVRGLGTATTSYVSPGLAVEGAGAGRGDGGWSSPSAVAIGAALIASLFGIAMLLLLRRHRQTPSERIAEHIAAGMPAKARVRQTGRLLTSLERSLSATEWYEGLSRDLDRAAIEQSPARVVAATGAVGVSVALVLVALSGMTLIALPVLAVSPVAVRMYVRSQVERQRRQFDDQLADHLAVVGGAMRAGHSLPAALANVLDDAPEPARREFGRAVADERLGATMEDALEHIADRMNSRDVEQVALLARLQREAGANASEMLDRVVETIRERQELRRTVRTLTAQGRMSRWVLTGLPIVVLLFLTLTNRGYVDPLYSTFLGNVLLGVAAVMVVLGSLVIRRIVDFKI